MCDFQEICEELSYRVGEIDLNNTTHLLALAHILRENKWTGDAIDELLNNLTLTEAKKPKAHKDSKTIKTLGGKKLSVEVINDIIQGKYFIKSYGLAGGGKYNSSKKKYTYDDIKKEISKQPGKKLYLTTAGSVIKVRSEFGERICKMGVSTSSKPRETYFNQISILYKISKLKGVEMVDKVAPGIGYEKMQIQNVDDHINSMLGKGHTPLPLFVDGVDTGVKINGGAKVKGSPKADLALGIDGKPNFFISYKHGDYQDKGGKVLKPSYQQYGSLKTFYTKDFNSKFKDSAIGSSTDSFLNDVIKDGHFKSGKTYFKGMTDVTIDDNGFVVIHQNNKKTTTKWKQDIELWKETRLTRVLNVLKKQKKVDAYFMDKSGWAVRRDLSKVPGGEDISMLAIFGSDYATGTPGKNNVNILMQDSKAFTISMMTDDGWESGDPSGVNFEVSETGHTMWNPKMGGSSTNIPSFADGYKPYLVARYTGEMDIGWNNGSTFLFGARLLIMPKDLAKGKTDI